MGRMVGGILVLGLGLSVAVPFVAMQGDGWPAVAALLVFAAAVADSVDGATALVSGRVSRLGAVDRRQLHLPTLRHEDSEVHERGP